MKIVCDACSAKYSIADDKVKGKVFKIRCKKCSNIIVVRGTAGAAEEAPPPQFDQKDTRVYDYGYDGGGAAPDGGGGGGEEPVWHLVIDQEQVGPLTVAEVQERFAAGQVDADTYVWREGFGDWQALGTVDVFTAMIAGAGGGGGADAVASMFGAPAGDEAGTVRSDPNDVFAAAARGGADAGDAADDDLFGARSAAPSRAAASHAGPALGEDDGGARGGGGRLRGERNENSVLFSLNNLAALASDAPRASAASSSSSSGGGGASSGAAQHGGGEGSGLIDIRSMASAYLGDKGAQKKPGSAGVGSIDDLPVFSAASFSEPAVILPSPAARQSNKTMFILMGVVALLAVVTTVLVLVVVLGGDKSSGGTPEVAASPGAGAGDPAAKPAEGGTPQPSAAEGGSAGGTGGATGGADPGPTAAAGGGDADKPAGADGDKPATAGTTADKPATRDDKPTRTATRDDKPTRTATRDDKPAKPDKPDKPSGGDCPDEVGCLLAEKPPACCSKYSKGKKPPGGTTTTDKKPAGGGDLPESLDSNLIKDGVNKVKSKIFACGDKYPGKKGTVKIAVKVTPDGSVTSAESKQAPDPGLGSCAASAIKGAKFAKTQRGGSFTYPFNF